MADRPTPQVAPNGAAGPPSGGQTAVQWRIAGTFGLLILATAIGVLLVFRFVDQERDRNLRAWQQRLGIVADSRAAEIDKWVARQTEEIATLTRNPSVQLFLTEFDLAGGDPAGVTDAAGQIEYLQNFLVVTADRAGFTAPILGPDVAANVERASPAGLAIVDTQGRPLAVTPAFQPPRLPADRGVGPEGTAQDLFLDRSGAPAMGFYAPVYSIQADAGPGAEIGYVVGVRQVAGALFPLLEQPGAIERSLEALLLRAGDNLVEYLSPRADGSAALTRPLAMNTPALAGAMALREPGSFGIYRDYRDTEVLVTGRALDAMPWVVAIKVDRGEALAASESRLTRLLVGLLLAIALAAAAIVAVWRHGASRRAAKAAQLYRLTADALEQQRNLLKLVTDSQPTSIFILDESGTYRFANKVAAETAGISSDDLLGKSLSAVIGPASAQRYLALNEEALDAGDARSRTARVNGQAQERVLISEHIPMSATTALPKSVLVVERDITAEVTERERRERTLEHLVQSLVNVVDRRDPYAAEHSLRVGRLSKLIAAEMGLDDVECETARFAGALMNVGKILVPESLLTRDTVLSEAERKQIQDGINATAELLAEVEFSGPVIETLRQSQERFDGRGWPRGLEGDEILLSARITAVANAFVGMVSARAHRPGLSVESVTSELLNEAGAAYDRRVVAALVNYLDNKGGRDDWQTDARPPA